MTECTDVVNERSDEEELLWTQTTCRAPGSSDLARSNNCLLIDRGTLQNLMDGQTDFVSYCEAAANRPAD